MEKDPARRRFPLADRNIEVIDDTLTGEVLLDEALKMMKQSEKMSVSSWIDLMSGTSCPSLPQFPPRRPALLVSFAHSRCCCCCCCCCFCGGGGDDIGTERKHLIHAYICKPMQQANALSQARLGT
jgi:hypothetical protein